MQQITVDRNLGELTQIIDHRIAGDIVVEAGPSLLLALIAERVIDILELSISPIAGDGDFISIEELLATFTIESEVVIDGTRLLQCSNRSNAANS
jgi:riboflavin biosynthesis pyrimidine reductase